MKKQTIDLGVFGNLLPKGAKLVVHPELPKVEFKRGKIKYKITDVRLLHPYGIDALVYCFNTMANEPDATECKIQIRMDVLEEDDLDIIEDIVMGYEYEAERRGKNGFVLGSRIITGAVTGVLEDGNIEVTFEFNRTFAKRVYEFAQQNGKKQINMSDLIVYEVDRSLEDSSEWLTSKWGGLSHDI